MTSRLSLQHHRCHIQPNQVSPWAGIVELARNKRPQRESKRKRRFSPRKQIPPIILAIHSFQKKLSIGQMPPSQKDQCHVIWAHVYFCSHLSASTFSAWPGGNNGPPPARVFPKSSAWNFERWPSPIACNHRRRSNDRTGPHVRDGMREAFVGWWIPLPEVFVQGDGGFPMARFDYRGICRDNFSILPWWWRLLRQRNNNISFP